MAEYCLICEETVSERCSFPDCPVKDIEDAKEALREYEIEQASDKRDRSE